MALIDIILNPLVWIIFILFISLVITLVLTLRSTHARTFIKMSIPFLARGRVLNAHYLPAKRMVDFNLLEVDKGKLKKWSQKQNDYRNKTIIKDSYYIESSSGYPVYVTVSGDSKTVDPVKGVDPSRFDDVMAKTLIQTGEEINDYFKGKEGEPDKIAGMTPGQMALLVIIAMFAMVAVLWMFSVNIADLTAAVQGAG